MNTRLIDGLLGVGPGPVEGLQSEDLNATLLAWPLGGQVRPHRNNEVDVISIVLAGEGSAHVDGEEYALRAGSILFIAKGAERSIKSLSDDFRYINVHKRRRGLMPL